MCILPKENGLHSHCGERQSNHYTKRVVTHSPQHQKKSKKSSKHQERTKTKNQAATKHIKRNDRCAQERENKNAHGDGEVGEAEKGGRRQRQGKKTSGPFAPLFLRSPPPPPPLPQSPRFFSLVTRAHAVNPTRHHPSFAFRHLGFRAHFASFRVTCACTRQDIH